MQYFIQGLRTDFQGHAILGQPRTLAEAQHLANLKRLSERTPPI